MTIMARRSLMWITALAISGCTAALAAENDWKIAQSTDSLTGARIASITRTAVALKSDPDFAGLMIRCGPKQKVDVSVILIRPLPPRARPQVTITGGREQKSFRGSMAAAGAAILLPDEAEALVSGSWQRTPALTVVVKDGTDEIKGALDLTGLSAAYGNLLNSCAP